MLSKYFEPLQYFANLLFCEMSEPQENMYRGYLHARNSAHHSAYAQTKNTEKKLVTPGLSNINIFKLSSFLFHFQHICANISCRQFHLQFC